MVTAVIGTDKYRTEITTGSKTFAADEPGELGGADTAPSPPEYLMSALASCTAITLRMYADRKKLNVSKITVQVTHSKEEFKSLFTVEVSYDGKMEMDQEKRFLDIAKMCPVHKILNSPIQIETKLAIY
ncbi:MAG TPA: OsmC family protein [Cyclobacteriaceae bacterium]|nr:OsmC family protein [Cyclobacteriaceae bacterium]HMV07532.1 OsmC family protein [Cyclobacteriaceae bacterium]HMV90169.1 OsmC family protein [Cyclobacteriaceae bacterium]HMX02808.1 OsmC family protein [Cyclobacteriaceae bacterium]HMX52117.1 OsmC family protein [Cyclobacteriaceae bacterium]